MTPHTKKNNCALKFKWIKKCNYYFFFFSVAVVQCYRWEHGDVYKLAKVWPFLHVTNFVWCITRGIISRSIRLLVKKKNIVEILIQISIRSKEHTEQMLVFCLCPFFVLRPWLLEVSNTIFLNLFTTYLLFRLDVKSVKSSQFFLTR